GHRQPRTVGGKPGDRLSGPRELYPVVDATPFVQAGKFSSIRLLPRLQRPGFGHCPQKSCRAAVTSHLHPGHVARMLRLERTTRTIGDPASATMTPRSFGTALDRRSGPPSRNGTMRSLGRTSECGLGVLAARYS